jgi:hypothetical protein
MCHQHLFSVCGTYPGWELMYLPDTCSGCHQGRSLRTQVKSQLESQKQYICMHAYIHIHIVCMDVYVYLITGSQVATPTWGKYHDGHVGLCQCAYMYVHWVNPSKSPLGAFDYGDPWPSAWFSSRYADLWTTHMQHGLVQSADSLSQSCVVWFRGLIYLDALLITWRMTMWCNSTPPVAPVLKTCIDAVCEMCNRCRAANMRLSGRVLCVCSILSIERRIK